MGLNHAESNSKEYRAWACMKTRCYNKNYSEYKYYGERGIVVCKRWKDNYKNFLKDLGRKPTVFHSLDRIDSNKDYSPSNCRWATPDEQWNNKRNSIFIEHDDCKLTIGQWAKKRGVKNNTLQNRINRGWTIEEALFKPIRKYNNKGE